MKTIDKYIDHWKSTTPALEAAPAARLEVDNSDGFKLAVGVLQTGHLHPEPPTLKNGSAPVGAVAGNENLAFGGNLSESCRVDFSVASFWRMAEWECWV